MIAVPVRVAVSIGVSGQPVRKGLRAQVVPDQPAARAARAVPFLIGAAFTILPFMHHWKRAGEKPFAACIALNFAAGCSRDASRLDEQDGMRLNLVGFAEGAADRGDHIFVGGGCAGVHFLNDDQALGSIPVNGKRGSARGPQRAVTSLHGMFQILGVVV